MKQRSNQGIVGATLIGIGCGLTAMGIALVIPACTNWSLDFVEPGGKEGPRCDGRSSRHTRRSRRARQPSL